MTITEHFFATDAAIIARLGRELVAKQETALIELIKNAFDADATEVVVRFLTEQPIPTMEIIDNGSGMTKKDLVEGFLRLASDKKVSEPVSPLFGRRRAGRKGIGRFSTHRLGDRLILTTRHRDELRGWKLDVDWADFAQGSELSAIPVKITEVSVAEHGTSIRIEHLFDEWSDSTIKRCWRNVLRLQQPFPVAPVEKRPANDPGFLVRFVRENTLLKDETVVADLQTEILDHMHAVVDFRVDDHGFASWRISKNRFAPIMDWRAINSYEPDALQPGPYKHLRNAWMRTYYVILLPELLPTMVFTRIRDELSQYGGLRLYRNGFRVVPYGDPDDDWLNLDQIYSKRTFLAPISNRNFFGVVEVRDPEGVMFEEHTSREGLLETPAFTELKHLASAILVTAAGSISDARGKKTFAGNRPVAKRDPIKQLKSAVDSFVLSTAELGKKFSVTDGAAEPVSEAEKVLAIAEEIQQEAEVAKAALADEVAMLRLLATLGMTTAEFSHETGMTFDAFRFDFQRVFEVATNSRPDDDEFLQNAERARSMLARLDALTSYLNTLASSRASRDVRPVSLSKVVEQFEHGIRRQAGSQAIDLEIRVPDYDPLYTRPMHEAEIASVLLNLYTNAVKAVKRAGGDRKILVIADRSDDESVRLSFSDTGDGVSEVNRERIFDAFFTTRIGTPAGGDDAEHAKGTGLGLWIVHQIVANAGGEISVIEPKGGFATTFELLIPRENENGD